MTSVTTCCTSNGAVSKGVDFDLIKALSRLSTRSAKVKTREEGSVVVEVVRELQDFENMFVVVQKVFDELFCELGKIPLERVTQTPEIGIPSLGTCASCDTGRTFHGTVPSVEYRTTRVILPLFPTWNIPETSSISRSL
jgi:hypothetical protein